MEIRRLILWGMMVSALLSSSLIVAYSYKDELSTAGETYDPRADFDNDGDIDIFDVVYIAGMYGATATPAPIIRNGDFECGTFANWWVCPNEAAYCAYIKDDIVHSGKYSAYITDERHAYNLIRQDIYLRTRLPAAFGFSLEGWIYPTRVGELLGEFPYSGILLRFCNESSMEQTFYVLYSWCASLTWSNSTRHANYYLSGWAASEWNFLSRNVTSDILAWNGGLDLSDIVLYSIEAACHYSTDTPGPFYVDDLVISIS